MGILCVILASVLYGCIPSLQEHVMLSGASPLGLVIVCNTAAALFALVLALLRRESLRIGKKQLLSLVLTGCVGLFLTDYLLNLSYTLMPVGFVTMIHFLYPTIVTLVMALLFRQKLTKWKVGVIVLSLTGLVLISGGAFSGSRWGILTALATALSYSYYMVANERLPTGEVPLMARSFYLNLMVALTALLLNLFTRSAVPPQSPGSLGLSVLTGCLICAATILLNAGILRLGAVKVSFINILEPVTSLVVSAIVFRYHVTAAAIVGSALILGSLLLVSLGELDKSRRSRSDRR